MTRLVGRLCFRHRWLVVIVWFGAMVGGGLSAGTVFERMGGGSELAGTESGAAYELLDAASDDGGAVVALWEGIDPSSSNVVGELERVRTGLAAITGIKEIQPPITANDGKGVAIIAVLAEGDDDVRDEAVEAASERLRELAGEAPGSTVLLGGGEIMNSEINAAVQEDLNRAEFSSLPVTVLIMIFVFGGLLAAGVPLIATLATVAGAFAMLLGFSEFVDLNADIISVVSMLGLALCIDYSLLLVARYREELAAGHEREQAIERTWATAGRTIAFSALIIAAALTGLLFIDVARLQAMGAAGISATVVALLSALTLTAALLRLFGRRIKPARRARQGRFFAGLAAITQRRPVLFAVGTAAVLLALGSPLLGATIKLPQMDGVPRDIESVHVYDELAGRYGQGDDPAVTVVARAGTPEELQRWAAGWSRDPIVSRVEAAEMVSPGLAAVWLHTHGDSQSAQASALVERMRADRPAGVDSWITGDAAVIVDLRAKIADGLPLALGVVALAMFVLLFLMTGSLVVPVKALLMNVVSLGATFGVLVAVFEHGWLSGPLDTLTVGGLSPFMMVLVFAFGFGLSMDYEVFLLARIKEHVDAGDDSNLAVRKGLQSSGRIITSAAALMLVVFGFFAAARLGDIEQIGLGLFVAVLVDATIVRCLLVPATMTLLGKWNWWAPGPLRRMHARLGVNG